MGINGTDAKGINDAGEIVGYYLDGSSVAHGFVYNNGAYVTLNDPAATGGTYAEGINDAGEVVGYYLDSSDVARGFVYSNGKYFNFDDSAAGKGASEGTFALAIDNAGRVSGYYVDSGFDVAGFLAKPAQSLTSGSIFADSGATVDLVGTSVVGGNLTTAAATNTSAAGLIDVTGNAISAIYDATVNNSGALGIERGSQLDVSARPLPAAVWVSPVSWIRSGLALLEVRPSPLPACSRQRATLSLSIRDHPSRTTTSCWRLPTAPSCWSVDRYKRRDRSGR